jgi:hypothetical protein
MALLLRLSLCLRPPCSCCRLISVFLALFCLSLFFLFPVSLFFYCSLVHSPPSLQVLNDTIRQRKNPKPTGGSGAGGASAMPSPAAPKPTAPASSNPYGGNAGGGSTGGASNNGAAVANR